MREKTSKIFILLFLIQNVIWAKHPVFSPNDTLIVLLQQKALNGDKRALRDLGYYLDFSDTKEKTIQIINDLLFFNENDFFIDNNTKKQEYIDFFYKNKDFLTFSPLYNAFTSKGFEQKKVNFRSLPLEKKEPDKEYRTTIDFLEQQIVAENPDSASNLLAKLAKYRSSEIYNIALRLAKDKKLSNNKTFKRSTFYRNLNEILGNYSSKEALETVLYLVDNELIAPSVSAFSLARISNVFCAHEVSDANLTKHYKKQIDSLKTFDALRTYGYERYGRFQKNYFDNDVDYFAALMTTSAIKDSYWWVKENAISDMLHTHHPRALYYLASQFYKERKATTPTFGYSQDYFFYNLKNYISTKIEIQNEKGEWVEKPTDIVGRKNFFLYWSKHWNDYEWDDYLNIFVNKESKLAQKENYERLFRRLTSTNDSVAVQSFQELAEGEPSEIVKLSAKYRTLLRNINPALPNFKSKILENLAFLNDFYRQQNTPIVISKKDAQLFNILLNQLSPSERYLIENQLISTLSAEQITAFEYWSILHENNLFSNYSSSRIIDYWYSQNINTILNDDRQLRNFLKKTALFSKLGVSGTCNMYVKKLDLKNEKNITALKKINQSDNDPDIISICQQLISSVKENKNLTNISPKIEQVNTKDLLKKLETSNTLSIENINIIFQSQDFRAEYRDICLKSLVKVANIEDIFLLKTQPKLSVKKGDLVYFNPIAFDSKTLDDLPRIFEVDDSEKLLAFMYERAKKFNIDEAGAFYNNLFRSIWFTNYVNSGVFPKKEALEIKQLLEKYLNESELISEFEEQATQRNIVQLENIGKPLLEKLASINNSALDDETRVKVFGEIIARVNYEDLGLIVPFLNQMGEINGRSMLYFLSEDFGLPIFEFKTNQESNDFVQNHAKLSEIEFYKLYLQKFGVDFLKKNGDLDYEKIYRILKYDLITPFSSAGGNKRDFYVYGIIKVLELKFVTQLNFHYKLNESQTFYSYNAGKRAEFWLKYLTENRIYRPEHYEAKSFNQ